MKYIITTVVLYALFFFLCYLGTGSDKKNIKSFYSYPDVIQNKVRQNGNLHKMIPIKRSYLASFLSNLLLFTIVFMLIGFILNLSEFVPSLLYFLLLGEGLNLFDLFVIDFLWWSRSTRIQFSGITDKNDYRGMRKHWAAFIRGIPVFACAALIAATFVGTIL